ncbi:DNA-binding transcriptional regulator, XRE-family HTH domain [Eubacterium aggregans]|uniref:DNA-binding transcriptional regulator, XRE-family HTH domain n=1 Tax=Eubacterium aggregans TaxID=81409 RepID=A0A1H4BPV6_9FIRM|nr:helix-turn-helix transcriptional regulator [Eubacterium aggregans]SEA50215.1 DNA-binding transcriptional regulator, XRE-family HTH domain [Eubacterium aggregans]
MNSRIKEIRKSLNMTQDEFGKKIGVARNSVASYEIGRRTPTEAIILSICREFRVNEEWFRTGAGDMFIAMNEDEEIAAFCGDLCAGSDPLIAKIVLYYARLSDEDKAFVRRMIEDLGHLVQ